MIQKVSSTKLYEQVVEQIKGMIVNGIYKKGDLLPSEKEIINLTGVSRITVREALKNLAEVGLIETHRGKGSIVIVEGNQLGGVQNQHLLRERHRDNFISSSETRLLIEPEVARKAAAVASDSDIAMLEKCLVHKNSRGKALNTESIFDDFHRGIFQITKNPILLTLFDDLIKLESDNQIHTVFIPPDRQKAISQELNSQHCKIFESIRSHDEEFAYYHMKEHMRYLSEAYADYFNRFF